MNRFGKRAIIPIIIANIILIITAVCWKVLTRFDYADHLDDAIITVDDKDITLREFGYYIYDVEAYVQRQALLYDPENPKHWWNTHFSAGMDSQFVCDYAKKVAINVCVADEIYYLEAINKNLTLDKSEERQAIEDAMEKINGMSTEQMEATGLNENLIFDISRKHALASKYAKLLVFNTNLTAYQEDPAKLVNWDGAYYLEEIYPKHNVWTNDRLLRQITLGKITVN